MEAIIYLVKTYMRFDDDETPTREIRKRATVLWATDTREEAAQDVRQFVKQQKNEDYIFYKKYWFIEETVLLKALINF